MAFGRPAVATVTFGTSAPVAGNTLTINGIAYTYGTDWGSRFSGTFTPNYVPGSSVRDLAELINGTDDQGRGSLTSSPNNTVYARAAGATLLLFAREPGTAGNAYTLSTSNSTAFVVSGATFSGGTAGAGMSTTSTIVNPTVTANFEDLAATESQVIPVGAKGWAVTVFTGSATINGKTVVEGYSGGDPNTLANTVTVTMAAASTGFVRWNT